MDKNKKLKELQNRLLGIELDIDLIEQDIENIDADIIYLNLLEKESVYNIEFVKKKALVVNLKMHKQTCQKLEHIRSKIIELKSKKENLLNKLKQKLASKTYYDREWDVLHKEIEDDKVILIFRKKSNETGNT